MRVNKEEVFADVETTKEVETISAIQYIGKRLDNSGFECELVDIAGDLSYEFSKDGTKIVIVETSNPEFVKLIVNGVKLTNGRIISDGKEGDGFGAREVITKLHSFGHIKEIRTVVKF